MCLNVCSAAFRSGFDEDTLFPERSSRTMSTDPNRNQPQHGHSHREPTPAAQSTDKPAAGNPAPPPAPKIVPPAPPVATPVGDLQKASGALPPKKLSAIDAAAEAFRAASAAKVEPAGGATHFALLRTRIQDGINKNLSKDAILDDLVTFETTRAFGTDATVEMRKKVADQFREDPRLAELFGELMTASRYTL